jgi:hypothetical protein
MINNNYIESTDNAIIIVPTYNRKHFFPSLFYQFEYQDYPKHLLKMIILDDSDISNQDYIDSLNIDIKDRVTYIYNEIKNTIGKKRNLLNNYAIEHGADYIICFDDDDYYPPDRVSYSIKSMKENNYHICGSSALLIYFQKLNKIYIHKSIVNKFFYGHACNGTLAYTKEYAKYNKYNDNKTYGEEKEFLRNFKIKLLQLDYTKVMLCIAHNLNTVDKYTYINNYDEYQYKIEDIIKNDFLLDFFI